MPPSHPADPASTPANGWKERPGDLSGAGRRRLPLGLRPLLWTQFLSALADNALLIVAIALLQQQGFAPWWAPMLKVGFNASYVLTAPFVGPLADAMPKRRLMAWMNALKMAGAAGLLFGANPVLAYAVVGLGAAAYAPAKYGLVTELVPPRQLVAANGWLEVSVVAAVLLGVALGGFLVSPSWLALSADLWPGWAASAGSFASAADSSVALSSPSPPEYGASLAALLGIYGLASVANVGVPDSGARYARPRRHPGVLLSEFIGAHRALWRDPDGGLSLAVTTLLWGAGATLQFVVLRWATEALGLTLDRASYLQAAVAVGVVVGAGLAGRFVALTQAKRLLPGGVLLGAMLPLLLQADSVLAATGALLTLGALSGFLVVPMNALLQHRGCALLSAGRSIAVQGANENASILVMLSVYGALTATGVPIAAVVWGFAAVLSAGVGVLWLHERRRRP